MGITFTRVVVLKESRHLAEIGNNGLVLYMFDREGNLMLDMVASMLLKEDYRIPTKYERIHYFRFKANYFFSELVKRGDKSAKLADHNTLLEDENRQLKVDNSELERRNKELGVEVDNRRKELNERYAANKNLTFQIEEMRTTIKSLECVIADLREQEMEWMGWRWSFKLFGKRIYIF